MPDCKKERLMVIFYHRYVKNYSEVEIISERFIIKEYQCKEKCKSYKKL